MVENLESFANVMSAPHLAAFHAARSHVYAAVAQLIGPNPTGAALFGLRHEIDAIPLGGSSRAHRELRGVLQAFGTDQIAAEHARLFRAPQGVFDIRCPRPTEGQANENVVDLRRIQGATWDAELKVMATLAERTAWAIRTSDFHAAAAQLELQAQWLDDDRQGSLSNFAQDLESKGAPLYSVVGRALRFQVADDILRLAFSSVPMG